MRIKADTGLCVGSGQCVLTEPAVFDQNDDGIVAILTDHPDHPARRAGAPRRHPMPIPSPLDPAGVGTTRVYYVSAPVEGDGSSGLASSASTLRARQELGTSGAWHLRDNLCYLA
ncbi:ferredoxin [Nonomuraea spiralis]|uniref:ferredoxin n=1 Tax=Nonomuraea spiralis TaxID=46182 RepID=UPI003792E507